MRPVLGQRLRDMLVLSEAQGALSGGGHQRKAAVLAAPRAPLLAVGPHVLQEHVRKIRWPVKEATAHGRIVRQLHMLSAKAHLALCISMKAVKCVSDFAVRHVEGAAVTVLAARREKSKKAVVEQMGSLSFIRRASAMVDWQKAPSCS